MVLVQLDPLSLTQVIIPACDVKPAQVTIIPRKSRASVRGPVHVNWSMGDTTAANGCWLYFHHRIASHGFGQWQPQASFDVVSQTSHVRRFYAAKILHLEGPAARGKAQRPGLVEVSDHLLMDVP